MRHAGMEVGGTIYDCGLQRVSSAASRWTGLAWLGSNVQAPGSAWLNKLPGLAQGSSAPASSSSLSRCNTSNKHVEISSVGGNIGKEVQ